MRFPLPLTFLAAGLFAALPASGSAQGYAFVEFSSQFDACYKASSDDKAAAITSAENALARLPHPLPRVHTEGTLPHQGIRDQSVAAERDWTAARDLAVGFCVTRREDFRVRALTFLSAWLTTYHPDFNPIDETNLDNLFLAEDLVGQGFTPDLNARWQDFSRAIAQNYLKQIDERHAELKSMHTAVAARGRGIGRAMLSHLIGAARERGFRQVSLETGSMSAFAPARSLYASAGFRRCGPFGDYRPSRNSTFMTLWLDGPGPVLEAGG